MARQKREQSSTGIYHIILRGVDRLFLCKGDYEHFIKLLEQYFRNQYLYGYILMENHVHLLIYDNKKEISDIIKPICTSYARYFNQYHEKQGRLFYDRYQSEVVENEQRMLEVLFFIHHNEVFSKYYYSSKQEYIHGGYICKVDSFLEKIGGSDVYRSYEQENKLVMCLDDYNRMSDDEVAKYIYKICDKKADEIKNLSKADRELCLKAIKKDKWISNRRISEITGIGRNVVDRAGKEKNQEKLKDDKNAETTSLDVWLL